MACLECSLPYALEGAVRRELASASASLLAAEHASVVRLTFTLPEGDAAALIQRLADLSHGAIVCSTVEDNSMA